jgi:hypothetical protein
VEIGRLESRPDQVPARRDFAIQRIILPERRVACSRPTCASVPRAQRGFDLAAAGDGLLIEILKNSLALSSGGVRGVVDRLASGFDALSLARLYTG